MRPWQHASRLARCRRYSKVVSYSESLALPETAFPLRPNHQTAVRPSTQALYDWQAARHTDEPPFILQDGPPFANGPLHMGHALNKTLKDMVNRYKLLQGKRIVYRPGWDCHGLPIELKALQQSKASSPLDVRRVARQLASDAIATQAQGFKQLGVMADYRNPYHTFDVDYEAAQLKVFGDMVERGLIFRAEKPVYWSPSSKTALAEAELEYNEKHVSDACYVAYPLTQESAGRLGLEHARLLIWTTTAWTIPANRAIAINSELMYSLVDGLVVAQDRVAALDFLGEASGSFKGGDLVGLQYTDVLSSDVRTVLAADYVSADSGTGLVHTAPGHGQDDFMLCRDQAPPILPFSPVDDAGCYTAQVGIASLVGLPVQTAGSRAVLALLKEAGALLQVSKYKHKYPYDWRSKTPIILRATPQWFANLAPIKQEAAEALASVRMTPEQGRARLLSFVAGRDEWCISRQRAWGVPIPALYAEDEVLMSRESVAYIIEQLKKRGSDAWFDPGEDESWVLPAHRHKSWRRGTDTLDVWFDSGCAWTTTQGTADLVVEGTDQHRGWFQSLLLTRIAAESKLPYKHVLTHGFVLDDKGRKMSKSLGNGIDPLEVISGRPAVEPATIPAMKDEKQRRKLIRQAEEAAQELKPLGVDTLRLWVASSDYTTDVHVSPAILAHVSESLRKMRSTTRYMLGNLNDYTSPSTLLLIDRYAVFLVQQCRKQVNAHYESCAFSKIVSLINHLSNATLSSFYFDTLKDRLYADARTSQSRQSAQTALAIILQEYMQMLAPICPSLIEEAWPYLPACLQRGEHIYAANWQQEEVMLSQEEQEAWQARMFVRSCVNKLLEEARRGKQIRSSLQAEVWLSGPGVEGLLGDASVDMANLLLVSRVHPMEQEDREVLAAGGCTVAEGDVTVAVYGASLQKCPRCWMYTAEGDALCGRCSRV
ncbi:tRNA synthetases class I-domain-containing protein [Protomyces lactucae-debilis]|uniref:Isoleucine--tRNA ligase, mitochondrial n=1 Tax=Protomyces lactucae-debilis TaxID=2754530 RepID=A0A1Y2F500_PROLT|nr:tRNA synthetases class I-domain-containing protein [Protomyces lactucae-debilis]ORY78933.1 tRNA synthetases class I-domain-containing protein [Protomyces lactucae-debilis]